jgi:hypothetical protein
MCEKKEKRIKKNKKKRNQMCLSDIYIYIRYDDAKNKTRIIIMTSQTFTLANNISEKKLFKGFFKATNLESLDSNHLLLMIHQDTNRAWVCDKFNNEIEYAFDAQSVAEVKLGLDGVSITREERSLSDFLYGGGYMQHSRPDVSDELDEGIFWDAKTGMIKMRYGLTDRVFEVRGPMVYVSPSLSAREISGLNPRFNFL